MDITPLFKACVKTVRTRNKAFGVQNDADKNRILKNKPKSTFITKAKEITSQISKLKELLMENRSAYLNFSSFIVGNKEMSDSERDQIDYALQRSITSCTHIIQELRRDSKKMSGGMQAVEFREAVLKIIDNYLKSISNIHSEQKALRVKRAMELRKISKLERESKNENKPEHKENDEILDEILGNVNKSDSTNEKENNSNNKNALEVAAEMDSLASSEDIQLSAEELQIFEAENVQLYNELNTLSDEVRQLEGKVLHIAELQEIFTEKVLQQDQDVDRISGTVMGVNENVRDANEQIRQAIQRNAGLRVWILFFLLVMSFSLLFLDWYND